jgi:hypothetical protein
MDNNIKWLLLNLIKDKGKCIRKEHNCKMCPVIKTCNRNLEEYSDTYYKDILEEAIKYYVLLCCEAQDKEGILAELKWMYWRFCYEQNTH